MNPRKEFLFNRRNRPNPRARAMLRIIYELTYKLDQAEDITGQPTAIPAGVIADILTDEGYPCSSATVRLTLQKLMHEESPFTTGEYKGLYLASRLGFHGGWLISAEAQPIKKRSRQEIQYQSSRNKQHKPMVLSALPDTNPVKIDENSY